MFGVARSDLDRPHYARADLLDPTWHQVLPWQPEAVIHAAALASPWSTRAEYESANIEATRRLLDWAEHCGRPRVVQVSSSSVTYIPGDQFDIAEDAPVGPTFVSEYSRTKAAAEQLVRAYSGSWVIARPRAIFGPGDTVVFPRILAAARAGRLPLVSGRASPVIGDVVYVDTAADYLLRLSTLTTSGVYHLTQGEPVDIEAMILTLLDSLGVPVPTRRVSVSRALRAAALAELLWRVLPLRGEPPITRYGVGVLTTSKTFEPGRTARDLGPPSVSTADGIERFVHWQRGQEPLE